MTHHRAGDELAVDDGDGNEAEANKFPAACDICQIGSLFPPAAGDDGGECGEAEERLRDAGVNDREIELDENDAQPAKDSLNDDHAEDAGGEPSNPAARFGEPCPDRQYDRERADDGSHEPMRVLIKDSADPEARRAEEHVVAVAVRAIRDGHARSMPGEQP